MSSTNNNDQVDHGYAWIIAASYFIWEMILAISFKTFGVLHVQLEELYGQSALKTSLVAFTMCLCWLIFAPVGGYMAYRMSHRMNIIIGAIMTTGVSFLPYHCV